MKQLFHSFAIALTLSGLALADPYPQSALGDWDITWHTQKQDYKGKLVLLVQQEKLFARLIFPEQKTFAFGTNSLQLSEEQIEADFKWGKDSRNWGKESLVLKAEFHDGTLVGNLTGERDSGSLTGQHRPLPLLQSRHICPELPLLDVKSSGIDEGRLSETIQRAAEEHSDALIVAKDGKIVWEGYSPGCKAEEPIYAMSASKSVVSLAIGLLVADGTLTLDTPVGKFFPNWSADKKAITVRQLLSHTSGVDGMRRNYREVTIEETFEKAEQLCPPSTWWSYNNVAVDFLSVIVRKAAGKPLDQFVQERLFGPMDIRGAFWGKDKQGDPTGAGELCLRPIDLAKIGMLMADGGRWQGRQLVPESWIKSSFEPSQAYDCSYGLLWWRTLPKSQLSYQFTAETLNYWNHLGLTPVESEKLRPLIGTAMDRPRFEELLGVERMNELQMRSDKLRSPLFARTTTVQSQSFSAIGFLGQYLTIIPGQKLVAVRMRTKEFLDNAPDGVGEAYGYSRFVADIESLQSQGDSK